MIEKDETLIKYKIAQGNEAAFSILYQEHVDLLFNYGRQITDQLSLIEDSIQDTFTSIWKSRENLPHVHSLKAYLMSSFRRTLLRSIHADRKRNIFPSFKLSDEYNQSTETILISQENKCIEEQKLREAVNKLSKRQREAIFLIYYEAMPYEQAAEVMELNVKTLYNLVYESIKKLKVILIGSSSFISWIIAFVI